MISERSRDTDNNDAENSALHHTKLLKLKKNFFLKMVLLNGYNISKLFFLYF